MTEPEITEVQNFIIDEVLPTYADGYATGEMISETIIGTLQLQNKYLLEPTELGVIILANRLEFRAMVEKELEKLEVEDD